MNQNMSIGQGAAEPTRRQYRVVWKRYVPILLTLAVGATFSFLMWEKAISNQDRHFRHEFERITDNYSLLITSWIESRFQALESIRSFYYGSQNIDSDEFAGFVEPYFKGRNDIHALLWAPLVRGGQRMQFEQTVREEGLGNFDIMESTEEGRLAIALQRDEYFPVLHIEPDESDTAIAGYDLASDPALANALNKSRQTGQIVASERVQFPGCREIQYGVCIFVPVYDKDAAQAGEDSTSLRGFVAGFLHIEGVVESALDITTITSLCINISDDQAPAATKVLYSHCSLPNGECRMAQCRSVPGERDDLQHRTHCRVGQRNWTISFAPCKDFFSAYRTSQPLLVLLAGLLVTVLTALCFLMGIGRTLRIERLVADRTQQLRTANDSLEAEIAEGKRIQSQKENLLRLLSVANNELIESNDKLLRSNQELEDFAYVASHDLQEPLRKVTAFGDRLKTKYSEALDETGRDYVERMQNAARRMSILINDMLTYSRVSSKAQPFAEVDLEETLREVLEDLEVHIEELSATVQVEPLPCIRADAVQMRQLMQNLISNALKFHKPDTPPAIRIYSRPVDKDDTSTTAGRAAVEVVVEDNGIGFDEKYADQIFRMFQRLHGRSEYEGAGVGLAVCRKIAERHGAAITARSISGQGAEFALTFTCDSIISQPKVTN